jgi:cation:H+ antiporter
LPRRATVIRITLALLGVVPGIIMALGHFELDPYLRMAIFGLAIWCAATILGWAAETAEMDITGALAMALLAIVAILPEYAVDVILAFKAGTDPSYEALASANMNGATRLLIGLALPLVVLAGLASRRRTRRRRTQAASGSLADAAAGAASPADGGKASAQGSKSSAPKRRPALIRLLGSTLDIPLAHYNTLFFLIVVAAMGCLAPLTGQVSAWLGGPLLILFAVFLWHASRGEVEEPELVGVAATLGRLPKARRRTVVIAFFLIAAATIFIGAEPFVDSLIESGHALGINEALLIQWLAPLASEAPEFIIALTLASRGKAPAAVGILLTSMVNQWSCLVGSLPFAFRLGGGSWSLPLDSRQVEEFLLTGSVTAVAVALLLSRRIPAWGAYFMLAVFVAEFALPDEHARLILAAVNGVGAIALVIANARYVQPLFKQPFVRE